jgi:putative ABC transport system substrate-binding protein
MRRREFIKWAGGAAVVWPVTARAQVSDKPIRIGFLPLGSASNAYDKSLVDAFRQGLAEAGLVEKRDFVLDIHWTVGEPEMAVKELIQRGAQLLVPCGSSASVAARRQAGTIPILFISVGNPIGMGLVESISHPKGNATGFSDVLADLSGKYVEIAWQLNPTRGTLYYLWHTRWPDGQNRFDATDRAAGSMGLTLQARGVASKEELSDAVSGLKESGAEAIMVQPSPFTYQQRTSIIDLAAKQGLATIYPFTPAARDGALVAYGPDYSHMYRRAASYVDRLAKGEKPADLPVQEPVKFDLIVNLKTAKALKIMMPQSLLARADEVID